MIPLTLGLREDRGGAPRDRRPRRRRRSREALDEAFASRSFWLLTFGFFVCGFHVAFVGLHLPAYISDKGVGMTALGITVSPLELGGWAIGLVGLFNIAGSLMWAWLGGRHKKQGHAGAALSPALARLRRCSWSCRCRGSACSPSRRRSASCGSARCR